MEEIQGRIQDIRDRLDSLETFDMAGDLHHHSYAPLDPKAVYGLDYIGDPSVTQHQGTSTPGRQ